MIDLTVLGAYLLLRAILQLFEILNPTMHVNPISYSHTGYDFQYDNKFIIVNQINLYDFLYQIYETVNTMNIHFVFRLAKLS